VVIPELLVYAMDIKRTVLWVVFSFSLLLLWDSWMRHNGQASMFSPAPDATQQAPATTEGGAQSLPQASAADAQIAGTATVADVGAAPAATTGQLITITTDVIKAEINTVGGQITRLELLNHKDTEDPTHNVVLFTSTPTDRYLGQTGLIKGNYPNHNTIFTAKDGARTLDNGQEVQLVLDAVKDGVKLEKVFTFKRGDYLIDIKHVVTNETAAPIAPELYLRLVRDGNKPKGDNFFYHTFTGPAIYTPAEKFQKVTFEDIEKGKTSHEKASNDGWTALLQHYFVSAFVPPQNMQRTIVTQKIDTNLYAVDTLLPLGSIAPGASSTLDVKLYSGPQESAVLEKIAPGLELVKDYGIFTIIAKPIFWLMAHIHAVVGNWGWTIILLTVLIKLVFFPLSAASYRSMAKMKTVAPKVQAIRERHKGEPQKMNAEMMALYKTEKINPLGGCLPMLVQIPVFISLYWVLLASVEMRNAPWLGWIHDLAAPDPFYILPVVMAVSMFVQTKLNPTPPDPIQAKIMMFMPIAFSVMFFFFPAGLVLYWVVNNILSITQQWVITRKIVKG
jgi:YidC/Oxa1 family membrane protein insertase